MPALLFLDVAKTRRADGRRACAPPCAGAQGFRYADIADAGLWTGKPSCLFRFCGSGAFCGFIGWFSGGGLGTHFEYVGSYADAFYIRLRRGRTYLLSCDGAEMAVKRVREGMQGKEC